MNKICLPDWYWTGKEYLLKAAAICAGTLSAAIIWSEVTFFVKDPVLSIFAAIVNLAKSNYDYFSIEVNLVDFISMCRKTNFVNISAHFNSRHCLFVFLCLLDCI